MITFTQGAKSKFRNNRSMPRWNADGNCVYRIDHELNACEGRIRNISCSGVSLIVSQSLSINQKVHLTIYIFGNNAIKVSGTVLWKRVIDRESMIGIRFFNASCETEDEILQYALFTNREELVNHWFEGLEKG